MTSLQQPLKFTGFLHLLNRTASAKLRSSSSLCLLATLLLSRYATLLIAGSTASPLVVRSNLATIPALFPIYTPFIYSSHPFSPYVFQIDQISFHHLAPLFGWQTAKKKGKTTSAPFPLGLFKLQTDAGLDSGRRVLSGVSLFLHLTDS